MRATLLGMHTWTLGGADVRLADVPCGAASPRRVPEPVRPALVEPGHWRRASRLARLALAVAAPAAVARDVDVVFGTGFGEFGSTAAFLTSLFVKGQDRASPLSFQNSVHNAPAAHLAIALGLRGPSETLCAGPDTVFATFERALARVVVRRVPVLVVLADDLGPATVAGLAHLEVQLGEGAAAFVLAPEGEGRTITLEDEVDPSAWRRSGGWPGEPAGRDERFGLTPVVDALMLAAGARGGAFAVTNGRSTLRVSA